MQLYGSTDKAIEFNSVCGDLERALGALESAKIGVAKERAEAERTKTYVNNMAKDLTNVSDIEAVYQAGVSQISKILESLEKHDVYYDSYNAAEDIQRKLNKATFDGEELKASAGVVIGLLIKINSSDTRYFANEESTVKKIYSVAYNMIKMELLMAGKSDVLAWVKTDKVASSQINSLIEEDAERIPENSILYEGTMEMLRHARSDDFKYSYLDEGIILYLAMHDSQNVAKIEASLLDVLNEVYRVEEEKNAQKNYNQMAANRIDELTALIKKSHIYKQIMLALGLIAAVAAIRQGSQELAKKIGHDEFRTRVDYYSSIGAEAPSYPEYMEKINDNYSKTTLTAYGVWNQKNLFYGDFERKIIQYNLSKTDLLNLEDYVNLDFASLSHKDPETETREELDASELYDKAIVEILRLVQDPNDVKFMPDEEAQEIFLSVISTINAVLMGAGSIFILLNTFKKLAERIRSGKLKEAEAIALADGLKKYQKLCEQNEEFRKRFIASYQKFEQVIKNSELKSGFERIRQNSSNK